MRQISREKRREMIAEAGIISHSIMDLAENSGFTGPNATNMLSNWLRRNGYYLEVVAYRIRKTKEGSAKNS